MDLDAGANRGAYELKADLLTSPFDVPTTWCVIAGAPSCGKTTLIDLLAAHSYRTAPEPARAFLEGEIARGRTIEDIHANGAALQQKLVHLQSALETSLCPSELIFLDSAVPSLMAWYRAFGLDPNEILPRCFRHRYAAVFVLDPLPLELDDVRFDDDKLIPFLDRWIARDYRALGYDVVRVPEMSPDLRLAFVLDGLAPRDSPRPCEATTDGLGGAAHRTGRRLVPPRR